MVIHRIGELALSQSMESTRQTTFRDEVPCGLDVALGRSVCYCLCIGHYSVYVLLCWFVGLLMTEHSWNSSPNSSRMDLILSQVFRSRFRFAVHRNTDHGFYDDCLVPRPS